MRQNKSCINPKVKQLECLTQEVVAYKRELIKGEVLPFHKHQRSQFVYASQGVMSVSTRTASYVIPPHRSVWMPEKKEHQIKAISDVTMSTLYIDSKLKDAFPAHVCILQVTPLLRELIISAVSGAPQYETNSPQARIMAVILDQISILPAVSIALPTPRDQRLIKITQALIENPADQRSLEFWANQVGASKRTLNRLFNTEVKMSFSDWRQQRRLHRAIELLTTGQSITSIALDVGYENTSAFIAMFKRCLGATPANYFKSQ